MTDVVVASYRNFQGYYKEGIMNTEDQIKGRIKDAKGKAKKASGKAVGMFKNAKSKLEARLGGLKKDIKKAL